MNLHAIVFDMDGVLVDSEKIIAQATILFFNTKGINLYSDELKPYIGTGEQNLLESIAEKYNIILPSDAKIKLYQIYKELIVGNLKMINGAREFINSCKSNNIKMAIATSADLDKLNANLNAVNLDKSLFNVIVTGEDVRHKKPAPDIYLLTALKLKIKSYNCLVIEDSINGITAAKLAGCKCLGITSSFDKSALNEADWIANDFTSIPYESITW